MKRFMLAPALLGLTLSAGLSAHHAAEGIVSDEIWNMIDLRLQEADSPHLNIDFDDVMASMRVETDDSGNLFLVTDITAYVTESVNELDDYLEAIEDTMASFESELDASNQVPSGNTTSDRASTAFFTVEEVVTDGDVPDYAVISLWEPIGNGNSQDDVDSPAPGKRAGG